MKSIERPDYELVLKVLRDARLKAGLSQVQMAKLLKKLQPFVSAAEVGRVRLDLLQLQDWARACGTDVVKLAQRFYDALPASQRAPAKKTVQSRRR